MSSKLKNKYLYLIVIVSITICLGLFYVFVISGKNEEEVFTPSTDLAEEGNQEKPEEIEDTSTLEVDLVDYENYSFDELDFQFIVAKIRVKSNEAINLKLDGFKTNEDILLSEVESFVTALEANGLFLGRLNVWYEILSQDTSTIANIFIPVKDKEATSVTLSFDFNDEFIEFDLTGKNSDASIFKYEADDIIFDGRSYQMKVSEAFEITGDKITRNYSDGFSEDYLSPSTAEMHAFNVEVVSLWGDEVVIEEAYYIVSETGEEFEAFNEQFKTEKYENLLNKEVTDLDKGIVFFETLNPSENPITYEGILRLKIKGQDNYIVINVNL